MNILMSMWTVDMRSFIFGLYQDSIFSQSKIVKCLMLSINHCIYCNSRKGKNFSNRWIIFLKSVGKMKNCPDRWIILVRSVENLKCFLSCGWENIFAHGYIQTCMDYWCKIMDFNHTFILWNQAYVGFVGLFVDNAIFETSWKTLIRYVLVVF